MNNSSIKHLPHYYNGRFVLREPIGSGRMSTVYLATDQNSPDKEIVLKVLDTSHSDEIKQELFRRETGALRRLKHKNIVTLHHSGWDITREVFFLVLDYLPYSLDQYLKGELTTKLPELQIHRVIRELAEALAYAHSEDIVHRDIKPSNILLDHDGRPLLTDFGISKLMTHLTIGETLAGFWSSGYASPEQRAAKPTAPTSDVYSLGVLYFQLLTGQAPPPDGPTPSHVDDHVQGPPQLRRLVKHMLAQSPGERPSSGAELLPSLEVTRRLERLPSHFLVLTNRALQDVVTSGACATGDFASVASALLEELGGAALNEIHLTSSENQQRREIILLGDSLRFLCVPEDDALIIRTIQTPYLPNLDQEKGRSMEYRANWQFVNRDFRADHNPSVLATATQDMTDLLATLSTFEIKGAKQKEKRASRYEFIETWNVALRTNRRRIEQEAASLSYTQVLIEQDYIQFHLTKLPPDDLDWTDDVPLAVKENRTASQISVGNLVGIRGLTVFVTRSGRRFEEKELNIPSAGILTINVMESLSANTRQQRAIGAFLTGQMANANVADAIVDPTTTTHTTVTDLDYYQDWLSSDKKEAVRRAISSNELFLIQGPPGSGKTSVIAEIVLQILKRQSDARILLTSQSNVAVDHALAQIAKAAGDDLPEMVRIGRSEKIGHGGQHWTLIERARTWRKDVLENCEPVLQELRRSEREARAAIKKEGVADLTEPGTNSTIEEWLAESRDLSDQLIEYEQEYRSMGTVASESARTAAAESVQQARVQLREQLEALNELLPHSVDSEGLTEESFLQEIQSTIARASIEPAHSQSPAIKKLQQAQELRQILTQWTRVVGLTEDFQELIGRSARVLAATCLFSARLFPRGQDFDRSKSESAFDWAIVDEAGRATVPEILIPVVRSERAIFVGDERQLPPMVDSLFLDKTVSSGDRQNLQTSLFQSLVDQAADTAGEKHIAVLRTQYRMHAHIGNLISNVFYDGVLQNGERTRARRRSLELMPAKVTWLSTSTQSNRRESRSGQSFENSSEAEVALALLEKLQTTAVRDRQRPSVGVISGYLAQVERLSARIDPENRERWSNLEIEVATVDSFQGRECDVIVYSTVRSNSAGKIGFLRDYRRLNVALSRARDLLVVIGDHVMMENATIGSALNPFASVIDHMKSHTDECRIVSAEVLKWL